MEQEGQCWGTIHVRRVATFPALCKFLQQSHPPGSVLCKFLQQSHPPGSVLCEFLQQTFLLRKTENRKRPDNLVFLSDSDERC